MRKVENESNNFSYFIKGKYVIEFSPNSRGFSGRPDQFLSIRWMHCKNTSWNSRGCVKRAVGKSGEVSSIYPSIVLYRPTWIAKVQRKYPALQLDKRSDILEVKAAQSLLSVVFASWILVSLTSGLISGINCRTMRSSDGASRSGPLLQTKQFSLSQDQNAGPAFDLQWTLKTLTKWKFTIRCFNVNRFEVQHCEQEQLR